MAEEIQIAGTEAKAKIRSPWAPALLPIITLGIYYFVWYYKINREMADLGRARDRAEVLLAEVNHRVANSLALVASLVKLAHDRAQELLKERAAAAAKP